MPIVARLDVVLPELGLDARELVEHVGDRVAEQLRSDVRAGVDSASGQAKPRKDDGKPQGYNTGTLAEGIERGSVTGDRARASTTVAPPPERRAYVNSNPQVMTLEGRMRRVIEGAVADYLEA